MYAFPNSFISSSLSDVSGSSTAALRMAPTNNKISSFAIKNNTDTPVTIKLPGGTTETVQANKTSIDLSSNGEYILLDKDGVKQFSAELENESFSTTLGSADGDFLVSVKLKPK
jgi:hypothetical protein